MLTVTFPDRESLEAAVNAVAKANADTGNPDDETTPIYRAERVLDSALLHEEQQA